MPDKVIVIGAGLAGLSAAITLQDAGVEVEVHESSDRIGGRVATDVIDGFRCDRGFQLINVRYPEIHRLGIIDELDFIAAKPTIDVAVGDLRYALGDPRSHPFSAFTAATGKFSEKVGFLAYLAQRSRAGTSVEDEMQPLGLLYSRVLKPFLMGVFLTAPSHVDAISGKEIVRSFITGKPGLPSQGAGTLATVLGARVRNIEVNSRIDSISQFTGRKVVVATDLTTAAQLLDIPSVPQLASSTTWYHEVPNEMTQSQRLLIDGQARGPVVNSIAISKMVPTYAPDGRTLLSSTTVEVASESEVRRHLALMWGTSTSNWSLIAKYEIPKSLPIFGVGSTGAQSARFSENVFIAGDYRSAPSQNGAMLSGRLAALELLGN